MPDFSNLRQHQWLPWLLPAWVLFPGFAAAQTRCEDLTSLAIKNVTVTAAQTVAAGSGRNLPAYCRVAATSRPTSDSDIKIEVWMPASGWNGKFQANGNGGWTGSISARTLSTGLLRGYATAMSDLGHEGASASFALGHLEKLIDYGYRGSHEMAVTAKAIITAHYGRAPKYSYWVGCSAGGRQAMDEAQRYPSDFDGIIAGAPGLNWTGRAFESIWVAQAVHKDEASYIPPSKYPLIHAAVLKACDALDGLRDGVLADPTRCQFDPKTLECTGSDGPACLSAAQVEAARKIYTAHTNAGTHRLVFPGLMRGSELGWATMGSPKPLDLGLDLFKYIVFEDPNWDYKTFQWDRDVDRTLKAERGITDALDPNLKPYFDRGGKLIQYHGWSDPQIPPGFSVDYFQRVVETLGGGAVASSYRLFMVPGMAHCGGGEGTSSFDMLTALENWVEGGKAPDRIIASRIKDGTVDRTRPLCPYPQSAVYSGTANPDDAANFSCQAQ